MVGECVSKENPKSDLDFDLDKNLFKTVVGDHIWSDFRSVFIYLLLTLFSQVELSHEAKKSRRGEIL